MEFYLQSGLNYGYPLCCILEFMETVGLYSEKKDRVSKRKGFLPCLKHVAEIEQGKIRLEDLIRNRKVVSPF